jgi:hypothetical protein
MRREHRRRAAVELPAVAPVQFAGVADADV